MLNGHHDAQIYLLVLVHDDVSVTHLGFWFHRHFDGVLDERYVGISDPLQFTFGWSDAIEDSDLVGGYKTSLFP